MGRKHTEPESLKLTESYLEGVPYQTVVDKYTLKLSSSTFSRLYSKILSLWRQ